MFWKDEDMQEGQIRLRVFPTGKTLQEICRKNFKTKKLEWMPVQKLGG